MVDDIGLDGSKVRLGQALGGGAHPHRIKWVRVLCHQKETTPSGVVSF